MTAMPPASRTTFQSILDRHGGIGPGFDLLRILLAAVIFYGHAKWASGANVAAAAFTAAADNTARLAEGGWTGWYRPFLISYVPAFFALSGFLVSGSALKTRVTKTFLAHRALRIFPALVVEVVLSAVLIGLFLTEFSLSRYFSDPLLLRYFGNILGWISFQLPGVFQDNPVKGIVNVNLWTLPAEFDCYLLTAILMATGLFYSRRIMTILMVAVMAVLAPLNMFTDFAVTQTTAAVHTVTFYFFVGVMFYHWRDRVQYSWPLFFLSGLLAYVTQMQHHLVYIAPIFVTYCTLFFGMTAVPKIKLIASGDYSYGIYLYGFPITQAVVELVPGARGNGWLTLGVAALGTVIFAAGSWHLIEKPTLRLKNRLPEKYFPRRALTAPATPSGRAAVAEHPATAAHQPAVGPLPTTTAPAGR